MIQALQSRGFSVLFSTAEQAFDLYWESMPHIIIDEGSDQCLNEQPIAKIRKVTPDIPIIVLGRENAPDCILHCLRCGAFDYLAPPWSNEELLESLDRAVIRLLQSFANTMILKQLVEERREYALDNSIDMIHGVISSLMPTINTFCSAKSANEIRMALFEILLNAIEHGNLRIGYDEKNDALDAGTYQQLFEERTRQHGHKKVRFVFIFRRNLFTFIVEDEGEGFNVKQLPDPRNAENLLKTSGRGILMSYFYMDRIQYNRKGNRVILIKRADKLCVQRPDFRSHP
ncbi:ATP-binding protein [Desulfurispirillum indicum]|uniref:ATP-binding response regulator n=1 Tax=Desulfurispirillum indicum TaxID=936456 RepID=UPI001CFB9DFB|nr:ATP-binding protein [Desulfurispirillum indicum]UCZ57098.1 ATP-binding protein [Desulfurispirillum indicum]